MRETKTGGCWRFLNEVEREFVVEPEKRVPVAYDVDVAVAGGGISGIFAAIAAGRLGAKTVLIERLGSLGGNIGPGHLVGGSIAGPPVESLPNGGLQGISLELVNKVQELRNTAAINYADTSNCVSYVAVKMAQEAGVELILSAYASDPIVDDDVVTGLFVEGKSGRVAVKARVVIDATGDADVAMRAGAPVMNYIPADEAYAPLIKNTWPYNSPDYPLYNDGGLFFNIGGVDFEKYQNFIAAEVSLSEDDKAWAAQNLRGPKVEQFPDAMTPAIRKAWEAGEFRTVREIEPGLFISSQGKMRYFDEYGVVGSRAAMAAGRFATYDIAQLSKIEAALRVQAFETVRFLNAHAPGFENAYIICISPFLGARGGPCIEGEHILIPQEMLSGRKFDDVVSSGMASNRYRTEEKESRETPYRILLPKKIDGLLVTGRGASYIRRGHDPGFRRRLNMMILGQTAGTAAALAVREGATPKNLDIKILQQQLVDSGIYLGDEERLRELGLRNR